MCKHWAKLYWSRKIIKRPPNISIKDYHYQKKLAASKILKDSYDHLAILDSAQGNFKQALAHYKLFVVVRDSLLNIENTKKITQQQMQYDFDKKEARGKSRTGKKRCHCERRIVEAENCSQWICRWLCRDVDFCSCGFYPAQQNQEKEKETDR